MLPGLHPYIHYIRMARVRPGHGIYLTNTHTHTHPLQVFRTPTAGFESH